MTFNWAKQSIIEQQFLNQRIECDQNLGAITPKGIIFKKVVAASIGFTVILAFIDRDKNADF